MIVRSAVTRYITQITVLIEKIFSKSSADTERDGPLVSAIADREEIRYLFNPPNNEKLGGCHKRQRRCHGPDISILIPNFTDITVLKRLRIESLSYVRFELD
ncbi:hypothetical protein RCL_jg3380.t1 [Rhizophagus clarus]|uniref:Uncharacterized protein n=1 Tax=Rhizophagus clarus TaxID=94130 RepID=A0A8H3R219_9GLOM|nr:hypothetical protein RCL_jg3380.t1 [Rhizophagus clarus]